MSDTTTPTGSLMTAVAENPLNPKRAQQMTGAAAESAATGVPSIAVRGNLHEVPAAQPTTPKTIPTVDLMKPVGVTEEARARTERKFKQTDVVDPALQTAIDGVKSDTKLAGLGAMGAQIQSMLTKHITDLYHQDKTGMDLIPVTDAQGKPVLDAAGQPTYKAKGGVTEAGDVLAAPEMTTKVKGLLSQLSGVKTDAERAELLGQLATEIGTVGPTGQVSISYESIAGLMKDSDEALGEVISKGLDDNVAVGPKLLKDLGYSDTDAADVLSELGFDPANPPTLKTFQAAVASHIDNVVAPIDREFARVNDPFASASEREEALENLRDMGYTGTLASRETLGRVAADVASAGTNVVIGNKTFDTLEDALSDDGVTWLVSGYLDGTIKKADMPAGLSAVIDNNREAFEDITQTLKTDIKSFDDIQKSWSTATLGVPDSVLSTIIPGYDPKTPYHTEPVRLPTSGIGKVILNPNTTPDVKTAVTNVATSISGSGIPATVSADIINNMSDTDIATLSDPVNGVTAKNNYVASLSLGHKVDQAIAKIPPAQLGSTDLSTRMDILESAFPGMDDLNETMTGLLSIKDRGDELGNSAHAILDTLSKLLGDGVTVQTMIDSIDILLDEGLGVGAVSDRNGNYNTWLDTLNKAKGAASGVNIQEGVRAAEEKRLADEKAKAAAERAAAEELLKKEAAILQASIDAGTPQGTAADNTITYGNMQRLYKSTGGKGSSSTAYAQRDKMVGGKKVATEWLVSGKWTTKRPV